MPSFSKNRVVVQPNTGAGFNKTLNYQIPRYGLVANSYMHVKTTYTADATALDRQMSRGLGALVFDRVSLSTHNQKIQTLYPEQLLAWYHSLPFEKRNSYLKAIENETANVSASTAVNTRG